ncbi:MAG: TonB-dependent receptor [Chitinophagaceae bacterium]
MKKIALFCAMMSFVYTSFAQKTIKGKITDKAAGTPLSGATISFGNKGGTTSDKDGVFTIECGKTSRITVSFVGYESQSISIRNCDDELNIALTSMGQSLDNVEISATSSSNKSLLAQPQSITKLSSVELKRGQGIFLDDAIQTSVPGVIMNRRTVSGGQQFNIRGYGNGSRGTRGISSNFDGQGYKVYLNGIPVTDAEGITTLDDIDYGSIGNVEIVKGPAGTLYGQAISGAINFSVNGGQKGRTSLEQQTMFGNYGLQRYTTILQASGERNSILLSYGKQKSDGFSIHNSSHKDFVNFVGDFNLNTKQTMTTFVGYTDSYDQRLGELTLQQWAAKDYSGNPEYIKRDGHSHVSTFRAGISHTYQFNGNISNTTSLFGMGFRSDVSSAGGWTDKTSVNYGFRTSFNTRFAVGSGASLSGITGMEVQKQDAQTVGYSMKANPADPSPGGPWVYGTSPYWIVNAVTSNNAFVTTPTAYFTEWTLALPHDLSFTAGIGLSTQRIVLDDRFNSPNATVARPAHFDTSYKKMASPHLAINKVFKKGISVYASYSTGFKAPVSSYFFITTPTVGSTPATARVNEVLKPEKGTQFEIGTKGNMFKERLVYQLALFHLKFKNKMTSVSVPVPATPPTATAYSYMINGGDQDHKGIEAFVKYAVVKNSGAFANITPFINFTYSDFKYGDNFVYKTGSTTANGGIDTLNYSGLNVFGVPKIMVSWGVDMSMKCGAYFTFSHLYKDPQNISLEKTQTFPLPEVFTLRKATSYNLLNTKLGYRRSLSAHFDLDVYFGINNITGVQYPIMIFINQLPDAYIPAPPKAVVYGGLNLRYNFGK